MRREEPDDYDGESLADWWRWCGEMLEWLSGSMPYGEEPDVPCWSDPHESSYKEPAERWAAEELLLEPTRKLVERFLGELDWVVECKCKHTLFFASERLRWSAQFCRMISSLPEGHGVAGLDAGGDVRAGDLWKWLAIDCYDSDVAWPKRWRDGCSAESYFW